MNRGANVRAPGTCPPRPDVGESWNRLHRRLLAAQLRRTSDPRVDVENEVAETVAAAWGRFGDEPCASDVTRWSRKVLSRRVLAADRALRVRSVTDHRVERYLVGGPTAHHLAEAREWIESARAILSEGERHTFDLMRQGVTANSELAQVQRTSVRCVEESRRAVRQRLARLSGSFADLCGQGASQAFT